jgi:hypothetical protein
LFVRWFVCLYGGLFVCSVACLCSCVGHAPPSALPRPCGKPPRRSSSLPHCGVFMLRPPMARLYVLQQRTRVGATSMVYREQAKRLEAYEQERLQRADELEQKRLQREQARGAWRGPMGSHSPLLHSNFKFPRALGFVSVPLAAWQHPHSKLRCTRMTTRTPYSTLYSTVTPCITMITPCSSGLLSLSLPVMRPLPKERTHYVAWDCAG